MYEAQRVVVDVSAVFNVVETAKGSTLNASKFS